MQRESTGSKVWWSFIKDVQGIIVNSPIPPLKGHDGYLAVKTKDKVNLLTEHFANKMQVHVPRRNPPATSERTNHTIEQLIIVKNMVFNPLKKCDPKKTTGPDHISMHILKRCADQLVLPHSVLFQTCVSQRKCPTLVVPVHKVM